MTTKAEFDYLIIGAGPAGLQLGYYLEKESKNYQILEAGDSAGTFFKKFPIVRGFVGPTQISEHHIIEDLASEWLEDVHTQPLLEFFRRELDREIGVNHLDFDQKIGDEKRQQHQVDKVA